jgi:hypothetical protein
MTDIVYAFVLVSVCLLASNIDRVVCLYFWLQNRHFHHAPQAPIFVGHLTVRTPHGAKCYSAGLVDAHLSQSEGAPQHLART